MTFSSALVTVISCFFLVSFSDTTPLIFGDYKRYMIGLRGGMYMQRLNERYADTGQVGFRVYQRVDGKLTLAEALRKLNAK